MPRLFHRAPERSVGADLHELVVRSERGVAHRHDPRRAAKAGDAAKGLRMDLPHTIWADVRARRPAAGSLPRRRSSCRRAFARSRRARSVLQATIPSGYRPRDPLMSIGRSSVIALLLTLPTLEGAQLFATASSVPTHLGNRCRLQQALTALFRRPPPIMFDPRAGRRRLRRRASSRSSAASSAPSLAWPPCSATRGPSVLCGSNRIGLERAASAERLVRPNRRILDLGVELSAEQDHDHRDPHPHHHADSRA